eukprot:TRINITY_DN1177_c0_g1_i2.p2 TRINITY_DN1177_c0_g1~~TRINITY_DN1177_c0_g1_i2.p2  ORF type:complete len:133 (+),score=12.71 TRINITY_DN1177_c0_g1_i2:119-517(+)
MSTSTVTVTYNDTVIAESSNCEVVEGMQHVPSNNPFFPSNYPPPPFPHSIPHSIPQSPPPSPPSVSNIYPTTPICLLIALLWLSTHLKKHMNHTLFPSHSVPHFPETLRRFLSFDSHTSSPPHLPPSSPILY